MPVLEWIRKRPWRTAGLAVAALSAVLATPVLLAEPRLDRKWVDNLAHMPNVSLSPGSFALDHVADWSYTREGPATREAITFANMFDDLRNVWFMVEPQPGGEYAAHTPRLCRRRNGRFGTSRRRGANEAEATPRSTG